MNEKIRTTILFIVSVSGVVAAIANVWLTSRIAPLAEDNARIEIRVQAIESTYARQDIVSIGLSNIEKKLENIEKKLKIYE